MKYCRVMFKYDQSQSEQWRQNNKYDQMYNQMNHTQTSTEVLWAAPLKFQGPFNPSNNVKTTKSGWIINQKRIS